MNSAMVVIPDDFNVYLISFFYTLDTDTPDDSPTQTDERVAATSLESAFEAVRTIWIGKDMSWTDDDQKQYAAKVNSVEFAEAKVENKYVTVALYSDQCTRA